MQDRPVKPLSDENANICEGKISKEECLKELSEMKNDRSPGSDGFPSEFF